jgi:hypothetical protein
MCYADICLGEGGGGTDENDINLIQNSWFPGRVLKTGPPEFLAAMLLTPSQPSSERVSIFKPSTVLNQGGFTVQVDAGTIP